MSLRNRCKEFIGGLHVEGEKSPFFYEGLVDNLQAFIVTEIKHASDERFDDAVPLAMTRMTSSEFDQMCRDICPRCNAGSAARQREDTREYVHDASDIAKGTMTHMICFATHFRNKYKDSVVG